MFFSLHIPLREFVKKKQIFYGQADVRGGGIKLDRKRFVNFFAFFTHYYPILTHF